MENNIEDENAKKLIQALLNGDSKLKLFKIEFNLKMWIMGVNSPMYVEAESSIDAINILVGLMGDSPHDVQLNNISVSKICHLSDIKRK